MDVGNFLELQRTLERDRIVSAAPEKERMLLAGKLLAPGNNLRLQRQHRLQRCGQMAQLAQGGTLPRLIVVTAQPGQRNGEQIERGELRGEGLGGGHANFHTGAGEVLELGQSHHGAGGHVADRERRVHSQALRVFQRSQGVGRFAGLRDDDDQRVAIGHARAIAVFARHFHLRGQAREFFQPILGRQARVITGAAREYQCRIDALEQPCRRTAEERRVDSVHVFERLRDSARLLEDFLLHVVAIGTQLRCAGARMNDADFALHRRAGAIDDAIAGAAHFCHIAFIEVNDAISGAGERHRVGSKKVFVLAQTHHEGTAKARAHHAARLVAAEGGDSVRTCQSFDGSLHGGKEIACIELVDEVRDHFAVGLTFE